MQSRPGSAFDVIGDVHGCLDELIELLTRLGYTLDQDGREFHVTAPEGRRAVFAGDLVNRGPKISGVLRLVMAMLKQGSAYAVRGNHDFYLLQGLRGRSVITEFGVAYGEAAASSLAQLSPEGEAFRMEVKRFIAALPVSLSLVGGKLIVAHAGLPAKYQREESVKARHFAVFGPGETDTTKWPGDYRGSAFVAYGHYARPDVRMRQNSICLDTGCLYGGKLTALRYPELEVVQVDAARVYFKSAKFKSRKKDGA